jgi:hypothetical protein
MITFRNHAPINANQEDMNEAYDAGNDWGHFRIYILHATRYHIIQSENSGMTHNGHDPHTYRTHLGAFDTSKDAIAWVLKVAGTDTLSQPAANDLLCDLGYEGEQA